MLLQPKLTQAQRCFQQILIFEPDHIKAHINLGHVLKLQPIGVLIHQIFQHHDRTKFQVYGYYLINATDEFTTQIQDGCDVFVNLAGLSPEAAARLIHDQDLRNWHIGTVLCYCINPANKQIVDI